MSEVFECQAVFEDSAFSLMARVHANGVNLTQAVTSSISIKVFDRADGSQVGPEYTPVVASAIFDTLQTDARWGVNTVGYNFRWDAADTVLPDGGKNYRIEITFTPTSGYPFTQPFNVPTRSLYRS